LGESIESLYTLQLAEVFQLFNNLRCIKKTAAKPLNGPALMMPPVRNFTTRPIISWDMVSNLTKTFVVFFGEHKNSLHIEAIIEHCFVESLGGTVEI
jgi:anaerobic ribonucleoside-triphosphate reductase